MTLKGTGGVFIQDMFTICMDPQQVVNQYFTWVYDIESVLSTSLKKEEVKNRVVRDKSPI